METNMLYEETKKVVAEHEEKLRKYVELLIKANEAARLTGPSDAETLWNDHIIDCLCAVPLLPRGGRVIDVGTGGGLPGIVWAIARPDLEFTLLDSIAKKMAQVEKITALLGLKNTRVICARSEDYAGQQDGKFAVTTARAVTEAGILAELLSPFAKIGGKIISFKGPRVTEELESVGNRWSELGLSAPKLVPYSYDEKKRYLLIWEKIARGPKGIPRRPGMAEKFPWYETRTKQKLSPKKERGHDEKRK